MQLPYYIVTVYAPIDYSVPVEHTFQTKSSAVALANKVADLWGFGEKRFTRQISGSTRVMAITDSSFGVELREVFQQEQ